MKNVLLFILGIFIYPIRFILKVKKNVWVFGSDKGIRYSQNSKFLYEYVIKNHKEIDCYWITQSRTVYKQLKKRNFPVLYNWSYKGLKMSLTAEVVIYSTWFNDILYTFPNIKRTFVYLMHGMPAKKVYYDNANNNESTFIQKIKTQLFKSFIYNQKLENMNFIPVTSPFFQKIVIGATRNNNVYITGQPRTDVFFSYNQIDLRNKYGFKEDDFIVTYMPTHRSYGRGLPSPQIFKNNVDFVNYFKQNNIKIVWKQHINMLNNYSYANVEEDSCFVDFSKNENVDSQELLYISDVLITDYSSCYIDFILLGKPILFFFYDDYEKVDNSLYILESNLEEVGLSARTESELYVNLVKVYNDKIGKDYSKHAKMYYSYFDNKSCERTFESIYKLTLE